MEPENKRPRQSVISDEIFEDELQKELSASWSGHVPLQRPNLEVMVQPFRICRISNFIKSEEFMDELKNELLDVKCRRNSIDLYQFEQTHDLAPVDSTNIRILYETFQRDLTQWMQKNTGIEVNDKISISSSCYSDTDYLLCHDDNMRDRRIAFVLYLSKNWTPEDGGALDLFDTDENGLPRNVVRSLTPEYNSLVFFEVTDNSYHQVAEITSPEKSRWSINGWFHGPLSDTAKKPEKRPDPVLDFFQPNMDEVDLGDWINNYYLFPDIVQEIQKNVEKESFAFLAGFLLKETYDKISTDLTSSSIRWKKVGPADLRNYEVAEEDSLPEFLREFYKIFKSISLFELLKRFTELDLVPEKENMKPKMTIELQRWSQGCYTLISDKTEQQIEKYYKSSKVEGEEEEDVAASSKQTTPSSRDDEDADSESSKQKYTLTKQKYTLTRQRKMRMSANGRQTSSSSSSSNKPISPPRKRNMDSEDSDVSDIGDYLSDSCSPECSDPPGEEEKDSEPGDLDVIIQFHTNQISGDESIDYVDPREQDGALIHVPAKDNHLCLVYKTEGTCRVHKYINHYCKGYFYNLICTYCE